MIILGIDLALRCHTAFGLLSLLVYRRDWARVYALSSQSGSYSFSGSVRSWLLICIVQISFLTDQGFRDFTYFLLSSTAQWLLYLVSPNFKVGGLCLRCDRV